MEGYGRGLIKALESWNSGPREKHANYNQHVRCPGRVSNREHPLEYRSVVQFFGGASHKSAGVPLSVHCGCLVPELSDVHHSIKCRYVGPVKVPVFLILALSKSHTGFMSSTPPGPQIIWFLPVTLPELRVMLVTAPPIPPVTPKLVYPEDGSVGKSSFLDRKPMKRIGFHPRRPHDCKYGWCQYTYCEELALIWKRTLCKMLTGRGE